MTIVKSVVAVAVVGLLLGGAASAAAQSTGTECQARIDLVHFDLDGIANAGRIGGNNPQQTYTSLASKLESATSKLNQRKQADALSKLQDFKTAVVAMRDSTKPKLFAADADLLLDGAEPSREFFDEGVNGAIACVALLP